MALPIISPNEHLNEQGKPYASGNEIRNPGTRGAYGFKATRKS